MIGREKNFTEVYAEKRTDYPASFGNVLFKYFLIFVVVRKTRWKLCLYKANVPIGRTWLRISELIVAWVLVTMKLELS